MSFSQFIKNYIDIINDFYDSFSSHMHLSLFVKFLILHIGQSVKFLIHYIFTFRWLNDFYSLKIKIPNIINSNFIDVYSSENAIYNFPNFFDIPNLTQSFVISGIVNSLILSIPCSSSQILWLRRLTVEGLPSGIISGLGIIAGQFLLSISMLLGFRFIIFPWYSMESLHYIFSVVLTLSIIYTIAHRPLIRIKSYETTQLVKIFVSHFILTWTEQSTIFQYISNISFNPETTLFEILNSQDPIESVISYGNYFIGLFFGLIFWTTFFGWAVLSIGYSSSKFFNFPYSKWVRTFHFSSLTLIIAFTLTSLPYYNLDYLFTSPLGFVSQDEALKRLQLRTNSIDLKKGRLGEYSSHTTLDTDVSPFDRGRYLTTSEVELTFEELNYQGEYVWRSRNDRLASGSGGMVNKLISKFLPKLKQKRIALSSILKSKKNIKKFEDTFENESFEEQEEIDAANYFSFADNEDLVQRFLGDYQSDLATSAIPDGDQDIDQEPYSAFSELVRYGFDSFAIFEDTNSDEFEEKLGKKIKSKYYSNFVYQSILNFDLSNFLNRQPKDFYLKEQEENDLFQQRLILEHYYDSLREYYKIPYSESFKDLFLGPKSYANRVYNQQYKGTLKILRRLFSISLNQKDNPKKKTILKFDQPLYKGQVSDQNNMLHEELSNNSTINRPILPFIREADPMPFYAGWDAKLRKFLMTNYYLAYSDTNVEVDYVNIFEPNDYDDSFLKKKDRTIYFITWPISKQRMEKLKYKPQKSINFISSSFDDPINDQQRDIFEYAESDDYDIRLIYEALPSIIKRVDLREKEKAQVYVQPIRGGIIWPGSEPLKFEIKNFFSKFIKRDWRDSNP